MAEVRTMGGPTIRPCIAAIGVRRDLGTVLALAPPSALPSWQATQPSAEADLTCGRRDTRGLLHICILAALARAIVLLCALGEREGNEGL